MPHLFPCVNGQLFCYTFIYRFRLLICACNTLIYAGRNSYACQTNIIINQNAQKREKKMSHNWTEQISQNVYTPSSPYTLSSIYQLGMKLRRSQSAYDRNTIHQCQRTKFIFILLEMWNVIKLMLSMTSRWFIYRAHLCWLEGKKICQKVSSRCAP